MSILDDFFGNSKKECACGETENITGISYNNMTGEYDKYICPKCKADADAEYAARIEADRRLGNRLDANTEENDG